MKRHAYHTEKAHEHMTKAMHHSEQASHDGGHERKATGEMSTVKRVAGSAKMAGKEEAGGCQGSKGIDGADPN